MISTNLYSSRVTGDGAWIVTWFIGFRLSHVIRVKSAGSSNHAYHQGTSSECAFPSRKFFLTENVLIDS